MTWAAAIFLVVGFLFLAKWTRLGRHAVGVLRCSQQGWVDLRDPELSDEQKERAMRDQTLRVLRCGGALAGSAALALGVPLGIVWLLGRVQALEFDEVMQRTLSWQFLLATTLLLCLAAVATRKGSLGTRH